MAIHYAQTITSVAIIKTLFILGATSQFHTMRYTAHLAVVRIAMQNARNLLVSTILNTHQKHSSKRLNQLTYFNALYNFISNKIRRK
jgi:hypothetical protein